MKTSLQAILIAVSIAAMASPVIMAQSLMPRPHVGESTANILNAHGSAAGRVSIGTRVARLMHPDRFCHDCVQRIEP
jgi:hypothetical protein